MISSKTKLVGATFLAKKWPALEPLAGKPCNLSGNHVGIWKLKDWKVKVWKEWLKPVWNYAVVWATVTFNHWETWFNHSTVARFNLILPLYPVPHQYHQCPSWMVILSAKRCHNYMFFFFYCENRSANCVRMVMFRGYVSHSQRVQIVFSNISHGISLIFHSHSHNFPS